LDQVGKFSFQLDFGLHTANMSISARLGNSGYVDRKSHCGLTPNGIVAPIVKNDVEQIVWSQIADGSHASQVH
jgi:hypothetical protein